MQKIFWVILPSLFVAIHWATCHILIHSVTVGISCKFGSEIQRWLKSGSVTKPQVLEGDPALAFDDIA
jgi:hypothetical protein